MKVKRQSWVQISTQSCSNIRKSNKLFKEFRLWILPLLTLWLPKTKYYARGLPLFRNSLLNLLFKKIMPKRHMTHVFICWIIFFSSSVFRIKVVIIEVIINRWDCTLFGKVVNRCWLIYFLKYVSWWNTSIHWVVLYLWTSY